MGKTEEKVRAAKLMRCEMGASPAEEETAEKKPKKSPQKLLSFADYSSTHTHGNTPPPAKRPGENRNAEVEAAGITCY